MFRKSVYEQVGGYRPEFYFGQDADLWLRMAEVSQLAYVPSVRYICRLRTDSISGALRPIQRYRTEAHQPFLSTEIT